MGSYVLVQTTTKTNGILALRKHAEIYQWMPYDAKRKRDVSDIFSPPILSVDFYVVCVEAIGHEAEMAIDTTILVIII